MDCGMKCFHITDSKICILKIREPNKFDHSDNEERETSLSSLYPRNNNRFGPLDSLFHVPFCLICIRSVLHISSYSLPSNYVFILGRLSCTHLPRFFIVGLSLHRVLLWCVILVTLFHLIAHKSLSNIHLQAYIFTVNHQTLRAQIRSER